MAGQPAKRARVDSGYCISPHHAGELQRHGPRFLKMLVTNATAGILIGKGGSALKDLETNSGCCVKLSPSGTFYPGSGGYRVVGVSGHEDSVEQVLASVLEASFEAERHIAQKEGREVEDRVLAQVAMPFTSCGLVIGKSGAMQKEIGEKTGIMVKITPQGQNVVPNERIATLQGSLGSVIAAATQVFRLIQSDASLGTHMETPAEGGFAHFQPQVIEPWQPAPPPRAAATPRAVPPPRGDWSAMVSPPAAAKPFNSGTGDFGGGTPCSIFFEVTDSEAAHIIGKAGSYLQMVCQDTGAKVQLTKRGERVPGSDKRIVTVSGPIQTVHAAHGLLMQRAAEVVPQEQRAA
ncbi:BTR1 [Symbiodinium natans]|uniref:BTR1 protein n=1 Tax=Symbiodinium natans TaxID=878477 RepID=A0A812I126_9DINO|nr:BTR1 [Symbiodinium natans]